MALEVKGVYKSVETKIKIAETFKQLTKEKAIKKITIQDMVTKCDLNRQTFYYHFQDIYDLIRWITERISISSLEQLIEEKGWETTFLESFLLIEQERDVYINLYKFLGGQKIMLYYKDGISEILVKKILSQTKNMKITSAEIKDIADFYAPGVVNIAMKWIQSGLEENPKSLAERLSLLLTEGICSAVKEFSK